VNSEMSDPIDNQIKAERSDARILISNIALVALLGFFLVNQQIEIGKLSETITNLSNNRVMYGVLSNDGRYFESVKDIPTRIIQNFSRSFIIDWANFTPETVEENRQSAVSKLNVEYAKKIERATDLSIVSFKNKKFAQQFIPMTYKEITDPDNPRYVKIIISGLRKQWQNGRSMGDPEGRTVEFNLQLQKAPPTASHPEGLEVINILEPAIKYDTDALGR
jgi:hypothetical protein